MTKQGAHPVTDEPSGRRGPPAGQRLLPSARAPVPAQELPPLALEHAGTPGPRARPRGPQSGAGLHAGSGSRGRLGATRPAGRRVAVGKGGGCWPLPARPLLRGARGSGPRGLPVPAIPARSLRTPRRGARRGPFHPPHQPPAAGLATFYQRRPPPSRKTATGPR